MSAFTGIITALSSMQAHQQAMNTTGHNLANVNTTGYRRQEVVLGSSSPYPGVGASDGPVGGQWGTGVEVVTIRRAQDGYIGSHMRTAGGETGQWTSAYNTLAEIEAVVDPGSDSNLGTVLDKFWNAWQTLSTSPDDMAAREEVLAQAQAVGSGFRDLVEQLRTTAANLDNIVSDSVKEINSLSGQIASLNRDISEALSEGRQPNDLLDQRDSLLSRMSQLCGVSPLDSTGGNIILNLNGRPLVQGQQAFKLTTTLDGSGHTQICWEEDSAVADIPGGEVAGYLQVRDEAIPRYLSELDNLVGALVTGVNTQHAAGYGLDGSTNVNFFTTGSTAANLTVDGEILNDVRKIATASASDQPGDGSVALTIAGLKNQALMAGGATVGEAWSSLLGEVGSDTQSAKSNMTSAESRYNQLLTQQQSIAGVSLDEELANMVQYQHAYDAAARMMTTADAMLDTIINRMAAP
jgi:flagellar hook-associated protein 1